MSLVAVPMIIAWIMSQFGQAIFPELVDEHPAWLLALNPQNRYLALTANQLDGWTYYPVGFTRLLLTDPLWFLIGYWYGDAAVAWTERHTRTWGELLRQIQRWFGKAAYPVIFIAPNSYICLFAGAAGMPFRRFLVVNATGTLARLYFFRVFGDVFDDSLDDVVGWIGDNRTLLLPITIAFTLLSLLLEFRRGETEVGSLSNLDDELDEAEREVEARNAQEPTDADTEASDPRP
ncbi:MAG: DedA family protein [Acidimicrobiales bacterium]